MFGNCSGKGWTQQFSRLLSGSVTTQPIRRVGYRNIANASMESNLLTNCSMKKGPSTRKRFTAELFFPTSERQKHPAFLPGRTKTSGRHYHQQFAIDEA